MQLVKLVHFCTFHTAICAAIPCIFHIAAHECLTSSSDVHQAAQLHGPAVTRSTSHHCLYIPFHCLHPSLPVCAAALFQCLLLCMLAPSSLVTLVVVPRHTHTHIYTLPEHQPLSSATQLRPAQFNCACFTSYICHACCQLQSQTSPSYPSKTTAAASWEGTQKRQPFTTLQHLPLAACSNTISGSSNAVCFCCVHTTACCCCCLRISQVLKVLDRTLDRLV